MRYALLHYTTYPIKHCTIIHTLHYKIQYIIYYTTYMVLFSTPYTTPYYIISHYDCTTLNSLSLTYQRF